MKGTVGSLFLSVGILIAALAINLPADAPPDKAPAKPATKTNTDTKPKFSTVVDPIGDTAKIETPAPAPAPTQATVAQTKQVAAPAAKVVATSTAVCTCGPECPCPCHKVTASPSPSPEIFDGGEDVEVVENFTEVRTAVWKPGPFRLFMWRQPDQVSRVPSGTVSIVSRRLPTSPANVSNVTSSTVYVKPSPPVVVRSSNSFSYPSSSCPAGVCSRRY